LRPFIRKCTVKLCAGSATQEFSLFFLRIFRFLKSSFFRIESQLLFPKYTLDYGRFSLGPLPTNIFCIVAMTTTFCFGAYMVS
jgi:hypothetical protein